MQGIIFEETAWQDAGYVQSMYMYDNMYPFHNVIDEVYMRTHLKIDADQSFWNRKLWWVCPPKSPSPFESLLPDSKFADLW